MTKELTKAELKAENDALKIVVQALSSGQEDLIKVCNQKLKFAMKYQAKLNSFYRRFNKLNQIILWTILALNTIVFALRWL